MIRNKLKSKRGETLVETLVAVLICCLAMAALASIMASSGEMMKKSSTKLESYYAQNAILSCAEDGSGTEGTVAVTSSGTRVKLSPDESESGTAVIYFENDAAGEKHPVTAYYAR